jgi:4-hydroxybenzoate polyprenyltransferase
MHSHVYDPTQLYCGNDETWKPIGGKENIQNGAPAIGLKLVGFAWSNPKSIPPPIIIVIVIIITTIILQFVSRFISSENLRENGKLYRYCFRTYTAKAFVRKNIH